MSKNQTKQRSYEPGDPQKLKAFLNKHKKPGGKKADLDTSKKPTKNQMKAWLITPTTIIQNDAIRLKGRSIIRAYPAGTIQSYLDKSIDDLPEPIYENAVDNLVVSSGKGFVCDLMLDEEAVGLTYHAIGTDSTPPALGNTALAAEAARKTWTTRNRTGAVMTYSVFYLAAECMFDITECGAFGGSTASATPDSGTLFSRYLQAYDNSAGLVDLTFEYELTVL